MKALLAVVALSTVLLAGCDSEGERQVATLQTAESFSNPEQVGTLPDGRNVYMVTHFIPGDFDRFIYYVDGGGVTENRTVPNGKSSREMTTFTAPAPEPAQTSQAQREQEAAAKVAEATKLVEEAKALLQTK